MRWQLFETTRAASPRINVIRLLLKVGFALNCFVVSGICSAFAMEFSFKMVKGELPVLYATGEIVSGDAARLREILPKVPRSSFFRKMVFLNSPGGSVDEAFAMAKVMDEFGVVTLVPSNASCASACAAVLFVAGTYQFVAPGGVLGVHTCYFSRSKVRSDDCNEQIAKFAMEHGTDYGAVMAPMVSTEADQMIWFSAKEADCWGLTKHPEGTEPSLWNQCTYAAARWAGGCVGERRAKCKNLKGLLAYLRKLLNETPWP